MDKHDSKAPLGFRQWWDNDSRWGDAEKLAEYDLALEAYLAGSAMVQQRIEALEAAAVELRYALQDRWAANSDSELYKANARVEAADSALAALLPGRGE